jgi:hypothetical protein
VTVPACDESSGANDISVMNRFSPIRLDVIRQVDPDRVHADAVCEIRLEQVSCIPVECAAPRDPVQIFQFCCEQNV